MSSRPGLLLLAEPQWLELLGERFEEEGYDVRALAVSQTWETRPDQAESRLKAALSELQQAVGPGTPIGAIGFGPGASWASAAVRLDLVRCGVAYGHDLAHLPRELSAFAGGDRVRLLIHCPDVSEPPAGFESPAGVRVRFYPVSERVLLEQSGAPQEVWIARTAHSATLELLRGTLGPHYDLSALWDQHCYFEFASRDTEAALDTMVSEPYVNHIPTLTGGFGRDDLRRFYSEHFIPKNPGDTSLEPISRTIGPDRVIDEMIFCFTHDREIDWMLPGVAPTGRRVEIPLVAIACFRGDKLYHEHIYWDQASVLVQIGLLDAAELPVAGAESPAKLRDPSLPSNRLIERAAASRAKARRAQGESS